MDVKSLSQYFNRSWVHWGVLFFPLGLALGGLIGFYMAKAHGVDSVGHIYELRHVLASQQRTLETLRNDSSAYQSVLRQRISSLEAKLVALDVSNDHLFSKLGVKRESTLGPHPWAAELDENNASSILDAMEEALALRAVQLRALEGLINNKTLYASRQLLGDGWPIAGGWISSHYGSRVDPFTGELAWHHGVDFAGAPGSEIKAVASGVVTWATTKRGYGPMVEIDHGNNLSTRYGHNETLLVKPGDVVQKGQVIATLGKGGRSTGYHVHFEVRLDGLPVDPASYFPPLAKLKPK